MNLAVVGLGLIGTSVCLAARRAWPDATLITLDRGDSLDPLARAQMVVLATPVDVIIDLVRHHARHFAGTAIIDTGSTKRAILSAARDAGLTNFVGGHPMAGAATPGPSEARADLFDHKPWFLIPAAPNAIALAQARAFVEALGARPAVMSDDGAEHDRLMAAVSHLPQVVASALMRVVGDAAGERGLAMAGGGLRDTTRLAGSSAEMWQSILATNGAELSPLLRRLSEDLRDLAESLSDAPTIRRLFDVARSYRDQLK